MEFYLNLQAQTVLSLYRYQLNEKVTQIFLCRRLRQILALKIYTVFYNAEVIVKCRNSYKILQNRSNDILKKFEDRFNSSLDNHQSRNTVVK